MADQHYIASPTKTPHTVGRGGGKEDRARTAIYKAQSAGCCAHHPDAHDERGCLRCNCAKPRTELKANGP